MSDTTDIVRTGRPTKRTPAIEDEILHRISSGETLRSICRTPAREDLPSFNAWYDWCEADEQLSVRFARARARGFDAIAEECAEIADDIVNDDIVTDGGVRPNAEWISRSKLRVETRLKLLAKWDPKRYGEKLDVAHSGQIDLAQRIAAARERDS
jgi:hypothetical protein